MKKIGLHGISYNGVAGFILANGALSGGGEEYKIRKQIIENDLVEAIVILPQNMFYSTDISVTLWILNRNKTERTVEVNDGVKNYRNREGEVLFMDLRQKGEPFEKKFIQFAEQEIEQIAATYHNWQQKDFETTYANEPEYCYSATLEEIRKKDYSLVPSKYIAFVNRDENIDYDTKMQTLQTELKDLFQQEETLKQEVANVFKSLGYEL
ncbi:N-6 DNA methylase [Empedobacter falsenii]|uniref:Type I restriction-modification system methyltransferase subunit n=1 Tax=Empedobacter falsenii TaxID=343874 RepID=A0A376GGR4_9FLAO|nr:N-6 DNA methylase [Empedobacter falsenii]STD58572.1 Type I restriction-modification system methyltransferase subunit [Empedobacter falsenii]